MSKRTGIVMILITSITLMITSGALNAGVVRTISLTAPRGGLQDATTTPTPYYYIDPLALRLQPDDVAEVTVRTSHVDDLGGVHVHLRWDPNLLRVIDTNPLVDGVQVLDGNLFEGQNSFSPPVVGNMVDNDLGELHYVRTMVRSPGGPTGVSGEFSVAIIPVQARAIGSCDLAFVGETMMTRLETGDLPAGAIDGDIIVSDTAETPTPTPEETVPIPTETATPTPMPTNTPMENGLYLPLVCSHFVE